VDYEPHSSDAIAIDQIDAIVTASNSLARAANSGAMSSTPWLKG